MRRIGAEREIEGTKLSYYKDYRNLANHILKYKHASRERETICPEGWATVWNAMPGIVANQHTEKPQTVLYTSNSALPDWHSQGLVWMAHNAQIVQWPSQDGKP